MNELVNSLAIGDKELVFIDEVEEGDRELGEPVFNGVGKLDGEGGARLANWRRRWKC